MARGVCMAGGACVVVGINGRGVCVVGACVAGETATAADGTHPTGMHSCFECALRLLVLHFISTSKLCGVF